MEHGYHKNQAPADPSLFESLDWLGSFRLHSLVESDTYENIADVSSGNRFWRMFRPFSPLTIDIWLLIAVYTACFLLVSVLIIFMLTMSPGVAGQNLPVTFQLIFGSAIFGGFLGVIFKLVENAQKRLAVAEIFVGDILSIGRVFAAANIPASFIHSYKDILVSGDVQALGLADVGKENYFGVFDKYAAELCPSSPQLVETVTSFYTFLRAARDARGRTARWTDEGCTVQHKRDDLENIVYLCFLTITNGRRAVEQLISDETDLRHSYAMKLFNSIELQTMLFLALILDDPDVRLRRIAGRASHAVRDIGDQDYRHIIEGAPDKVRIVLQGLCAGSEQQPTRPH